jgi:murein DD-endopeptidase MepM/ murein hydrolase activator NlpD
MNSFCSLLLRIVLICCPIFLWGCSWIFGGGYGSEEAAAVKNIGVGSGRIADPNYSLGQAQQYKGRMYWPVPGVKPFSKFGRRRGRWHDGVDLAAPVGTPIYAAHSGTVEYSGDGFKSFGNLIAIKGSGLVTFYAHNDENLVRKGDSVQGGQLIGFVGKTGRVTGPHLHFETRIVRSRAAPIAVDPMRFFRR